MIGKLSLVFICFVCSIAKAQNHSHSAPHLGTTAPKAHVGHGTHSAFVHSGAVHDPLKGDFSQLKLAKSPEIVDLSKHDVFELRASVVKQIVDGKTFRRFAYNGSIPGPLFKVKQGKTAKIRFINETDVETSIHSHGLRHSWKMDGQVPTSQPSVKPGESFLYEWKFPDAGVFWYHPHIREDYQQDMGLMGNFLVEPETPTFWNKVNREDVLMLDDMLAKTPVPYPKDFANYAIMGRFGDTMLINGQEFFEGEFKAGEVVRYYITNAANARTFRVKFVGAKMKLVGSGLGPLEQEVFVDFVTIASGERYVVEVLFPKSGAVKIENANPIKPLVLAKFNSKGSQEGETLEKSFETLRKNSNLTSELESAGKVVSAPGKTCLRA